MLVIHPSDKTTDFLRPLYADRKEVKCVTGRESRNELGSLIYHLRPGEPVMLLGHGNESGLFRLEEDGEYHLYVGHAMSYALRRHPVIGIWCHADRFARKEHLYGLFSGMIVSEMKEAQEYGIECSQEELDLSNERFAHLLRNALGHCPDLAGIPEEMSMAASVESELERFNFNSLYYFQGWL